MKWLSSMMRVVRNPSMQMGKFDRPVQIVSCHDNAIATDQVNYPPFLLGNRKRCRNIIILQRTELLEFYYGERSDSMISCRICPPTGKSRFILKISVKDKSRVHTIV